MEGELSNPPLSRARMVLFREGFDGYPENHRRDAEAPVLYGDGARYRRPYMATVGGCSTGDYQNGLGEAEVCYQGRGDRLFPCHAWQSSYLVPLGCQCLRFACAREPLTLRMESLRRRNRDSAYPAWHAGLQYLSDRTGSPSLSRTCNSIQGEGF